MDEESFEERFPSLKGDIFTVEDPDWDGEFPILLNVVSLDIIDEYCIDKQRLKSIIEKLSWFDEDNEGHIISLKELLNELGLNGKNT